MPEETPKEDFKYWAFICYSHTDEKWGQWLHRSLETYRVPKHLVGKSSRVGIVPKRVFPVFRDRDELPGSANLGEHIEAALKQSRYLIVICSPRAVASKWVDQEIRIFKSLGREDRVLCLVVEGEPHATTRHDCHEPECLPDAARFWVHSDRSITPIPTEPIAADARKGKDGKKYALLKLLSGMLGVDYDSLRRREEERRQRQQHLTLAVSIVLLVFFSLIGYQFYVQRNQAVTAGEVAKEQYLRAVEAAKTALQAQKLEEQARTNAVAAAQEAKQSAEAALTAKKLAEEEKKKADEAAEAVKRANEELGKALTSEKAAKDLAVEKEQAIRQTLALSDLATAARLSEEGNDSKALAYLSRALRYDSENVAVISRILSIFSQKNWALPLVAPFQHDGPVKNATFTPDGKKVLTRAGNSAVLWNAVTGKRIYAVQHSAAINSVELSPDGKFFITASHDNTAQIWETETGNRFGKPFRHNDHVMHASFSPDGKWVATASLDKTAALWEMATGRSFVLQPDDGTSRGLKVQKVRFTPDGKSIVTASGNSARRWELATGQRIGISMTHDSDIQCLAISPDGNWIATSAREGARLWNAITGEPTTPVLPHEGWVQDMKFSADSRLLLTASTDTTAKLWEVTTGKNINVFKHEFGVSSASFSPNGRWIATATADGSARIWKITGELFCEGLHHSIVINDAQFSPDGRFLVTASEDSSAKIWTISSSRPAAPPLLHEEQVNTACFSPDGRLLATASNDRTARIWDVKTAQPLGDALRHADRPICAAFSSDGKLFATGTEGGNGSVQLWDVLTGKAVLKESIPHNGSVNSVKFSPDGRRLVTASQDRRTRVLDASNGSIIFELPADGPVKKAAFSENGKWIIATAEAKNVRIWDAETGKPASTNLVHPEIVLSAALSPDGRFVATGCDDKQARLWDRATGELLLTLPHDSKVKTVSFTPAVVWNETRETARKQWLLTVSEKIARVWDVNKGKALTEPLKSDDEIGAATFGPHGNLLITAAGKNIRIWEASTGRSVTGPMEYEKEIRCVTFSPDGNFVAVTTADQTARILLVSLHGGAPGWFADMVDAVASYKLDDFGAAESFSDWNKFQSVQDMLSATHSTDNYAVWARWFLGDRSNRSIAPFATTRVGEYARRRAEEGSSKSLEEALDLQPANALALVKLARFSKEPAQAEFLARLAESYEPQNEEVLWIQSQVLQGLNQFSEALDVMERALSLDAKNVRTFGPNGLEVSSTEWLPKGWSDYSPADAPASCLKVTDAPQPGVTALEISGKKAVELHGPRVVCRRSKKIVIEGWSRSTGRNDFILRLAQFIEPSQTYKEQLIHTTPDWKPFKISFSTTQDIAAELRLLCSPQNSVQIAGVVCRVE